MKRGHGGHQGHVYARLTSAPGTSALPTLASLRTPGTVQPLPCPCCVSMCVGLFIYPNTHSVSASLSVCGTACTCLSRCYLTIWVGDQVWHWRQGPIWARAITQPAGLQLAPKPTKIRVRVEERMTIYPSIYPFVCQLAPPVSLSVCLSVLPNELNRTAIFGVTHTHNSSSLQLCQGILCAS